MIRVRWSSGRVTEYPAAKFAEPQTDTASVLLYAEAGGSSLAMVANFEAIEFGEEIHGLYFGPGTSPKLHKGKEPSS